VIKALFNPDGSINFMGLMTLEKEYRYLMIDCLFTRKQIKTIIINLWRKKRKHEIARRWSKETFVKAMVLMFGVGRMTVYNWIKEVK